MKKISRSFSFVFCGRQTKHVSATFYRVCNTIISICFKNLEQKQNKLAPQQSSKTTKLIGLQKFATLVQQNVHNTAAL